MSRLSIIVPALDEACGIAATLTAARAAAPHPAEIIVVDGGSGDATVACARPLADQVTQAPRGRAHQMNAGAALAHGDILLFLHADTLLPAQAEKIIRDGLAASGRCWGRFDVALEGTHPMLRIIAALMNWRSRWTGIATGDQAVFVTRDAFARVGGFPAIALMEDIALARALKRLGPPLCLRDKVRTAGRRWETHGLARTVLLMWGLRLAYFLGVDPARLARRYTRTQADA